MRMDSYWQAREPALQLCEIDLNAGKGEGRYRCWGGPTYFHMCEGGRNQVKVGRDRVDVVNFENFRLD